MRKNNLINRPLWSIFASHVLVIALVAVLQGLSFQATAQTTPNRPASASVVPQKQFTVFSISLPDNKWGFGIRENGQTVFVSHDRSQPNWQEKPVYNTELEATQAAEVKKAEFVAASLKVQKPSTPKQ